MFVRITILTILLMISWNPFRKATAAEPVRVIEITAEQHLAPGAAFNPDNPFPWIGFRELSPNVISSLSDNDIHRAVSDHFELRQDAARVEGFVLSREDFSKEIFLLYAVWVLETEVRNGGFWQYFRNQSPQTVQDGLSGLEMIQADCSLKILRKAISENSESTRPTGDATTEFHACQTDLDSKRAKFLRSLSESQLSVSRGG